MAKRHAKAAREGEDKAFGGATADAAHDHLRRQAVTSSDVPSPLSNQMLDSLERYLDNIAVVATQAVGNGGPLAELSVSLAISVDIVAAQAK